MAGRQGVGESGGLGQVLFRLYFGVRLRFQVQEALLLLHKFVFVQPCRIVKKTTPLCNWLGQMSSSPAAATATAAALGAAVLYQHVYLRWPGYPSTTTSCVLPPLPMQLIYASSLFTYNFSHFSCMCTHCMLEHIATPITYRY